MVGGEKSNLSFYDCVCQVLRMYAVLMAHVRTCDAYLDWQGRVARPGYRGSVYSLEGYGYAISVARRGGGVFGGTSRS